MIDEVGVFNNIPYPRSNRILLWYGWKDDPENDEKNGLNIGMQKELFNVWECLVNIDDVTEKLY
jgi:hypothetical protein